MRKELTQVGKHSLVYAAGEGLSLAASFLLIPLYTHVLPPEEYAVVELINRTALILRIVMFLGLRSAYFRFYLDKDDLVWRKRVTATTLLFLLTSSVVVGLAFLPFAGMTAEFLFQERSLQYLFVFMILWLPFEIVVDVGMGYLQVNMKSIPFVAMNLVKMISLIGSNIVLVYVMRRGVDGIMITNVWVHAAIGVGFIAFFVRWAGISLDMRILKGLIRFGLPYVPTSFMVFIIGTADRYFLSRFVSMQAVGIYAVAYKISSASSAFITAPFLKVWGPFLFSNYKKKEGPELVGRLFLLFTVTSFGSVIAVSVAAILLLPLVTGEAYHHAFYLVPFLCVATCFQGMSCLADAGILVTDKTYLKPFIYGAVCVVNLVANAALVPMFAEKGAALALLVTNFAMLACNLVVSSRLYKMKIEYGKVALVMVAYCASMGAFTVTLRAGPEKAIFQLLSSLSIALFPVLLLMLRVITMEEIRSLLALWPGRKARDTGIDTDTYLS